MAAPLPIYNPGLFLHTEVTKSPPYALLILDQPISDKTFFLRLWKNATLRVCADGGANRLLGLFEDKKQAAEFIPDCITGDLDSIRPETRAYYMTRGVALVPDVSQYATDFSKGLNWISSHTPPDVGKLTVFAYGAIGGRLDHTFQALHQLFKFSEGLLDNDGFAPRLYLIAPPNLTFLLRKGRNRLVISKQIFGRGLCGILPVKGEAHIKTTGLRWDLNWVSGIGDVGLGLSTSNELGDGEVIEVESESDGIVFTVELATETVL